MVHCPDPDSAEREMSASYAVGETGAALAPHAEVALSPDRMAYMADILLELKEMAAASGHTTLAGLLALAHVEAKQRAG